MNNLQYERWKQLSVGLARVHENLTPARKARLAEEVENCIDWVVCNGLGTIDDWDDGVRGKDGRYAHDSAGDRVDQFLWDNRYEFERERKSGCVDLVRGRFGDMLSACVRAGFDMAVEPSAGVIGFTVGDLRAIFNGVVPDWIAEHFEHPELLSAAAPDEGVWL